MYAPLRLIYGLRPHASVGLLLAALTAALIFTMSPFVVPDIATDFDIAVGTAGALSTLQVGGFALANFLAGRLLRPTVGLLRVGLVLLAVMDFGSALTPNFGALLVFRIGAGMGAGIITWVAWADAMHERRRLADVAAVGPLGAVLAAPIIGALVEAGGFRLAYAAAGILAAVALMVPPRLAEEAAPRRRRHVSPSRSNLVLLAALLMLTLAGSSVFIYAAGVAADELSLGPLAVSFAYSLNAGAGVAATRVQLMRTGTVVWFVVIAASVVAVASGAHPVVFYVGMTTWGFGFWMTVPRVLHMLAERSLSPDERVGDAQAGMAIGRAIGPLMGAPLATAAAYLALGGVAAAGTMLAGLMVTGVQFYRRTHLEPSSPPLVWRL